MKVGKNIEIVSLMPRRASVRLLMPFGASYEMPPLSAETFAAMQRASLAGRSTQLQPPEGGEVNPSLTFDQVNPQDADYIYPKFRALDAALVEEYWIDFSQPGVVEKAVPLMLGRTIYSNHVFWKIENWIGAVSQSIWDPTGDKANGKPGMNTVLKVDWKKSPMVARGLLMKPPAIDAVSATIDFLWDASHPDLLEQGIFWRNLGQNIDDQIVRIIVTEIRRFYELSLVYMGANEGSNGQLPDDAEETEFSAPRLATKPPLQLAKAKETTKVKFTPEQIAKLAAAGVIVAENEEVSDLRILTEIERLSGRASAADAIISAQRAEVLRLATIAEANAEGKLSDVLATMIATADASQLPGLQTLYADRAEKKFTRTCQKCGASGADIANRSSVEDPPAVGTEQPARMPTSNLL